MTVCDTSILTATFVGSKLDMIILHVPTSPFLITAGHMHNIILSFGTALGLRVERCVSACMGPANLVP
jgi:hypothetical protein